MQSVLQVTAVEEHKEEQGGDRRKEKIKETVVKTVIVKCNTGDRDTDHLLLLQGIRVQFSAITIDDTTT